MIYLDNAGTTRVYDEAIEAMKEVYSNTFYIYIYIYMVYLIYMVYHMYSFHLIQIPYVFESHFMCWVFTMKK